MSNLDAMLTDPEAVRRLAWVIREHQRIPGDFGEVVGPGEVGRWRQSCAGFECPWRDMTDEQHPIHHEEHVVDVFVRTIQDVLP